MPEVLTELSVVSVLFVIFVYKKVAYLLNCSVEVKCLLDLSDGLIVYHIKLNTRRYISLVGGRPLWRLGSPLAADYFLLFLFFICLACSF